MDGSCAGPARIEFLPPLEITLEQHIVSTKGTVAEEDSVSEESDEEGDQVGSPLPKNEITYSTTEDSRVNF